MLLTEETYEKGLKNAVRVKELEMQATHGKERKIFQAQIDKLNNDLANLPQAFEEAQIQIAKLKAKLEREGNEIGAEKLAVAIIALEQGDFSKADELFAEIEAREELAVERSARSAFARGEIAEQEVRWQDAAEHYARAAQLAPSFKNLNMAQTFAINMNDDDSALSFSLQAQTVAIKEYGEESHEYASTINNLGTIYKTQKIYEKAEPLYQKSLQISIKLIGEEHPQIATILDNLAVLYQEQKKYKKAFPLRNKALKIYKKTLGKNHPDTAICISNLAFIHQRQGNYKEAKLLHKQSLKIRQKVLGNAHPYTADGFSSLGGIYYDQKHYNKAAPMFKCALEIFEKVLGHDHLKTNLARTNYETAQKSIS